MTDKPVACLVLIAVALMMMAALIFTRLGHYALWDDEAITALGAKGVMRTGDTSVLMDHGNVVAYRGGINIIGFCDRQIPPLATYLTAASFTLFGEDAWAGRLPFAFFGLGTVALILLWVRQSSWPVLIMLALGLIGNVSFILYSRQCRYYAMAIFFSTAIAFIYWQGKPNPRNLLVLSALSVLLFASHYLDYLALYLCLAVDYAIWKRREWPPSWQNALLLFGPQLVLIGIIAYVWNPLQTQFTESLSTNTFGDRLTLFFWIWRDMDRCEFLALPLFLLALGVGVAQRRTWLVRGCLALALYVTVIAVISPQPVDLTSVADIRYLAPVIPLAIALETGAIVVLLPGRTILAVVVAVIVFGTNLLNGGPLLDGGLRSTLFSYVGELVHPPPEPYTPTAKWINEHVPPGDSVWVLPDYAAYPLMFHAPKALYAWQFAWPPRPDFARLPLIQFMGQEPPDYLIAFGPAVPTMAQAIQNANWPNVNYKEVAIINVFWKDLYRPELFWRTFQPVTGFDPNRQGIHIFQKVVLPAAPVGP